MTFFFRYSLSLPVLTGCSSIANPLDGDNVVFRAVFLRVMAGGRNFLYSGTRKEVEPVRHIRRAREKIPETEHEFNGFRRAIAVGAPMNVLLITTPITFFGMADGDTQADRSPPVLNDEDESVELEMFEYQGPNLLRMLLRGIAVSRRVIRETEARQIVGDAAVL